MSVLLEFSMFPTDRGASVSPYVAKLEMAIRSMGHASQLTAMGTIVETPTLEEAFEVIAAAYQAIEADAQRIYISANFDVRPGPLGRLKAKVSSVEDKIKKLQA